jgi:enoyl-CoA hydratase/carnithine racemase
MLSSEKEWSQTPIDQQGKLPSSGFGGISCRNGKKPIIAAVNGLCIGGGTEMVINCDIAVTSTNASFSLPDVKVGLTELGGCLPRLVRAIGRQRATMMALTGRTISAELAKEWGLIYSVTPDAVHEAITIAQEIVGNSPDAVLATRQGLLMGWAGMGAEEAGTAFVETWWPILQAGENANEGVAAFLEKRKPQWRGSKL